MPKQLKKELKLVDVFAIGTGTTLSGGFFLLPGIAAYYVGPALVLCYVLAMIPLIPAILCKVELATAMPRSGGMYYFVDRTLGPMMGTIAGLGTWLTYSLKSAFALIGMGAYLSHFIGENFLIPIAVGFAFFFGLLNLFGSKEASAIQVLLVIGILFLLGGFIVTGFFRFQPAHFKDFLGSGWNAIFATTGLVYISFMGLSKITSVAEEVKDPERNIPLGMFLAFGVSCLVYFFGTMIMVGVLPMKELASNLTPVASVAEHFAGTTGKILVTVAAVLAFASVTNAGILGASRYPLAMSRDHLLPGYLKKFSVRNIPVNSVLVTVGSIILFILTFDPTKIAKLASSFMLLIFALNCLAVIIMRESGIEAYDPGYKAPFYPWLPLFGIFSSLALVIEMGQAALLFCVGLIMVSIFWYFYYARPRVERGGAILHVFERLGKLRHQGLETEMRGILQEKGLREHDPYDELVAHAYLLDVQEPMRFDTLIQEVAGTLGEKLSYPAEKIAQEFLQGTKAGGTPVSKGVALPHIRLSRIIEPELVMVRAKEGVKMDLGETFWGAHKPEGKVHAILFLVSPEENPKQHLRILAKIAGRVDDADFMEEWLGAENELQLKELLLRDANFVSLTVRANTKSSALIEKRLRDIRMPEDTLIAVINRQGLPIVPSGKKVLKEGDRITVIGEPEGIKEFRRTYIS